jgi:signal transduction histidine kinase
MPADPRRLGSVRVRITLVTTVAFALALGLAATLLVRTVRESTKKQIRQENASFLNRLGTTIAGAGVHGALPTPPPDLRYFVFDPAGKLIVGPGAPGGVQAGTIVTGSAVAVPPKGGDALVVVQQAASPQGPVTLVAASPLDQVRRSVDALVRVLWLALPLLVSLVGVVAWLLVGRALRPVDAIRRKVEEISHSTLDRRVAVPSGNDEIARLAHTMNDMLDRLQTSSIRQREFVSDASHELRSPITTIRAAVEVALRHPAQANWKAVGEQVLGEDERLEQIVAELLELARTEESTSDRTGAVVELDDLVVSEAARVRATARVTVDAQNVSGAHVRGSGPQLRRLIANLVGNAARHATSRIEIALIDHGTHVELTVDDDGPGVPVPDRERIFDRFVRLDLSRERDGGGFGLGLAMVQAIVTRHGGTVRVADSQLGGASFVVSLPAAAMQPATV